MLKLLITSLHTCCFDFAKWSINDVSALPWLINDVSAILISILKMVSALASLTVFTAFKLLSSSSTFTQTCTMVRKSLNLVQF